MSATDLNPDHDTLGKIHDAQTCFGIPPESCALAYRSIADALETHASTMPHKTFLIHYDGTGEREELTYAEVNALANQTANLLLRMNVKRGNRVATLGYNHSDTLILYFACWKIGAAVAPLNSAEDNQRLAYILKNSEAVILFARREFLDRANEIASEAYQIGSLREIVQVGSSPQSGYRHLQRERTQLPTQLQSGDLALISDEALLVYTSGTTGNPKGVVLTQRNLLADARGISEWNGISPEQRMMCVLPLHHVNGITVTTITPLYAGASMVLNRTYSPTHFWERIAREKVQIVSVVPTLLQYSLEYAEKALKMHESIWGNNVTKEDLGSFRRFLCSAGTLSLNLAKRFEDMFGFPIIHGYGLSETTCITCFLPVEHDWVTHTKWMQEFGYPSIGVPIAVNEMAIFDRSGDGSRLGPGERGEICVRGHNIMKYYFQRPEANQESFKFGWFRTGDEGFYEIGDDKQAYYFITGRIKELINRGGVKFSPFDIEEVILELPEVNVALAVGFENTYYGEEVGAYVVLSDGCALTEQQIIDHCRARLTFEKSPKVVIFGDEIPVTSTGKYQRLQLHRLFSGWREYQFRKDG